MIAQTPSGRTLIHLKGAGHNGLFWSWQVGVLWLEYTKESVDGSLAYIIQLATEAVFEYIAS